MMQREQVFAKSNQLVENRCFDVALTDPWKLKMDYAESLVKSCECVR
jgi:hypothetical protein